MQQVQVHNIIKQNKTLVDVVCDTFSQRNKTTETKIKRVVKLDKSLEKAGGGGGEVDKQKVRHPLPIIIPSGILQVITPTWESINLKLNYLKYFESNLVNFESDIVGLPVTSNMTLHNKFLKRLDKHKKIVATTVTKITR